MVLLSVPKSVCKHYRRQTHRKLLRDTLWARPDLLMWIIFSYPKSLLETKPEKIVAPHQNGRMDLQKPPFLSLVFVTHESVWMNNSSTLRAIPSKQVSNYFEPKPYLIWSCFLIHHLRNPSCVTSQFQNKLGDLVLLKEKNKIKLCKEIGYSTDMIIQNSLRCKLRIPWSVYNQTCMYMYFGIFLNSLKQNKDSHLSLKYQILWELCNCFFLSPCNLTLI